MSLYEPVYGTDIYGYHKGIMFDNVNFILNEAQAQEDKKIIKPVISDIVKTEKALQSEITSKYNLFKQKEPQTVSGSGKYNFKKKKFNF